MDSTIGNFTDAPSTSGAQPAARPRPRPRPRVVMKKVVTSDYNPDAAGTSFSHIDDPPTSTTGKTTDSIHPATTPSVGLFDAVDDAYSSFGIAERAKMRSRKSQTAKKPTYQMNEVIELTSDEDELALKSPKRQKKQGNPVPKPKAQTKPRPKPTLKVKPAVVLPSGSPSSRTVIRDSPAPPAQRASSTQPPASTLPTIPPSTPPQARELTPPSSPPVTTRKRKRVRPSIADDDDDDEMDIIGGNHSEVSPSFAPPPPFFAPSSSSMPTDSGVDIPPVESFSGRGKKKQVPSSKKGTQPKTQKKGKKGKKMEISSTVDEVVEESARITQEPPTPATENTSFTEECYSPVVGNSTATKNAAGKQIAKEGKARMVDSSEEKNELVPPSKSNRARTPPESEEEGQSSKRKVHELPFLRHFTHTYDPGKLATGRFQSQKKRSATRAHFNLWSSSSWFFSQTQVNPHV